MKKIITVVALLLIVSITYSQNDEKRIKFNRGSLKICTSSHMKISGYDGDEVIIKSLNNKSHRILYGDFKYLRADTVRLNGNVKNVKNDKNGIIKNDSIFSNNFRYFVNSRSQKKLEKGLKPLGNKSTNPADNLYLDITEKEGELIINDFSYSKVFINNSNKYEILIPNSIKLLWNTNNCSKTKANTFFLTSKPWKLSNFKGEVEISSSYGSINLTDVNGPVIANTIGGDIKVVFDKVSPTNLYSLISNDGYIDVTLPQNASLNLDAIGDRILSDIDFKVLNDDIANGVKKMRLQLNSGKTKMKLDAGSGSVYLRKQ